MPIARIFQPIALTLKASVQLDTYAAHHVARVLRARVGDELIVFNGEGGEYQGTIQHIDKKSVSVTLHQYNAQDNESPLELYLAQGISRGEKMDFTIQKAVELGTKKIFPLVTERCNVKLDDARAAKRLQHWSSIIVSACEQSGRNRLPDIAAPESLETFLVSFENTQKFVLAPHSNKKLTDQTLNKALPIILLIGPEGGLSQAEIQLAEQYGYSALTLGPRILRTETAGLAALAVLQFHAGDLS